MTADPGFAAFWAVYPRKARKIEARYEWWRAARIFETDAILVTAAYYAAAVARHASSDIALAADWLRGLERPVAPEPQSGIYGLDLAKLGDAFLTACVISHQLGHEHVRDTIRDYVAPHGPYDAERQFVNDILMGRNARDLITQEEITEWLRALRLPPLAGEAS